MGAYNLLTQSVLVIMGLFFLVTALAIFGVAFLWSIHRDTKAQTKHLFNIYQVLTYIRTKDGDVLTAEKLEKLRTGRRGRTRLGDEL